VLDNKFVYEVKPAHWQFGQKYLDARKQIGRYTNATRLPGTWKHFELGQPALIAVAYVEMWHLAGNVGVTYYYDKVNPGSGLIFYEISPMLRRNPDQEKMTVSGLSVWPNPGNGR